MKRLLMNYTVLVSLMGFEFLYSQETIDSILKDLETEIALEQKTNSKKTLKSDGKIEISGRDPIEVSLESLSQEVFAVRREVDNLSKEVEVVNLKSRNETDQMGLVKIDIGFPSSNDTRLSSSVELKINGIPVYELMDLKTTVNGKHRFLVIDSAFPVGDYEFVLSVRQSSLEGNGNPIPLMVSSKNISILAKKRIYLTANVSKESKEIRWSSHL